MHFLRDFFVSAVLKSSCIHLYTVVFGFGFLRRSTSCVHAVVRAVLSRTHAKTTIFRGAHKYLRVIHGH